MSDLIPWQEFEAAVPAGPLGADDAERLRKALTQPPIPYYGEVAVAAAYRYQNEHPKASEAA